MTFDLKNRFSDPFLIIPGELAAFIESMPESLLKVVQMEAVASLVLLAWPDMAFRTSRADDGG
jgi:hypothetical protein